MTLNFSQNQTYKPKILYKITSKNQRKVHHEKQLKSFVCLIDDKTTGILKNKKLKSLVFLLIIKQLKS